MHRWTKKSSYSSFFTCCLWEAHNLTHSHALTPTQRQLSCPLPAGGKRSDIELQHKSSTYSQFCSTHTPHESFFVCTRRSTRLEAACSVFTAEGCQIWGWPLIVAHGARMNGNVNCIPPTFPHLLFPYHISITNYYATPSQISPDL